MSKLLFMYQELARPERVVVVDVAVGVVGDVRILEPQLAVLRPNVCFAHIRMAISNRLRFGPCQYEPGLEFNPDYRPTEQEMLDDFGESSSTPFPG